MPQVKTNFYWTQTKQHVKKVIVHVDQRCDIDRFVLFREEESHWFEGPSRNIHEDETQSTHCYLWLTGRHSTNSF
ncbi:hypothetical protein Syun_014707 [Stephania yunnanensis]|uniref:Uncharacterized protein n=1 Tax=Stephania yunnanensis TaxID=152371 RepID=A0AAP0JM64_9MAGN